MEVSQECLDSEPKKEAKMPPLCAGILGLGPNCGLGSLKANSAVSSITEGLVRAAPTPAE
jgi:hypothetical protein